MSWCERIAAAMVATMVAALPGGCGFHLRGDVTYPPEMGTTYIEASDHYTPFYRKMKASLRGSGVTVTSNPARAGAVLRILEDTSGQRVLTVSARNVPNEYDVYYIVKYSLEISGKEAVPAERHARNRDYTYDETLVLGMDSQSEVIREALADDLVGLVSRRLSAVK